MPKREPCREIAKTPPTRNLFLESQFREAVHVHSVCTWGDVFSRLALTIEICPPPQVRAKRENNCPLVHTLLFFYFWQDLRTRVSKQFP